MTRGMCHTPLSIARVQDFGGRGERRAYPSVIASSDVGYQKHGCMYLSARGTIHCILVLFALVLCSVVWNQIKFFFRKIHQLAFTENVGSSAPT